MDRNARRRLLIIQRAMGLLLLLISGVVLVIAAHGETPADRDCTALLLLVPLSLMLLFSHDAIIR